MQHRLLVSAATVVALAAPLSSCGFDYATDRVYDVTSANENREGVVDVLGAVVVSAAEGSGTFVASLSNNDSTEEQTFTAVAGQDATVTGAEFEPITIPAGGLVNLADPPADIVLTGNFTAGDVVPLTVDFGNGERISIDVPVVSDDSGYWEGLDAS
jgi:copper(I)-binding protein